MWYFLTQLFFKTQSRLKIISFLIFFDLYVFVDYIFGVNNGIWECLMLFGVNVVVVENILSISSRVSPEKIKTDILTR